MPEEHDNSQQDYDQNEAGDSTEHQTHTTALVLLVVTTLVVTAVVLSVGQSVEDLNPENYGQQDQGPEQMTQSDGPAVPVETPETQEEDGLTGFPEGLSMPDDAEIVRNYSSSLNDASSQRIALYDTSESVENLAQIYVDWAESNSYTPETVEVENDKAAVIANQNNDKLIVAVSTNNNQRRVQLNFVSRNSDSQ